ncbi:MAG: preprotein translocase subunit SecG [Patescibacteria group bacterium]
MAAILSVIQLILAGLLTGAVLLQQRGTALGGTFAGEGTVYSSRRGVEKYLFYATIFLAVAFIAVAILGIILA